MSAPLDGIYVETPRTRCGPHIISSDIRPATAEDVALAEQLHALGKCPHNVVRDEPGWMYDYRWCVTCGAGLGLI